MKNVLDILSTGLDPDIRTKFRESVETMLRHYSFLVDTGHQNITDIRDHQVSDEHIETIFVLCAFFHIVVAPLALPGRPTDLQLVSTIAISHGSSRFDRDSAHATQNMLQGFHDLLRKLHIQMSWIEVLHAEEVVFRVKRTLDPNHDQG